MPLANFSNLDFHQVTITLQDYLKSNSKRSRNKLIMTELAPSSYIQTLSGKVDEVIEADHFSEIFNDNFEDRGKVMKTQSFTVKEYNDSEKERLGRLKKVIETEYREKNHEVYSFVFNINPSN